MRKGRHHCFSDADLLVANERSDWAKKTSCNQTYLLSLFDTGRKERGEGRPGPAGMMVRGVNREKAGRKTKEPRVIHCSPHSNSHSAFFMPGS